MAFKYLFQYLLSVWPLFSQPQPYNASSPSISLAPDACSTCLTTSNVLFASPLDESYAAEYEPYNLRLQYKPIAIAYPTTEDQVSLTVSCAASCGVKVQAKSGGQSFASYSSGGQDGSIVVDLRYLNSISLDPSTNIATVGGGARIGNLAVAIQNAGNRALPLSASPGLGVGGYFTQGGFAYTSRTWGLALDAIRALDLVLANGTKVRATQESNQDLYWACRGACDSFGIAVSFQLKTEPAPPVITNWDFDFSKTITDSVKATDVIFAALNFAYASSQSGSFGIHIGPRRFHIVGQYVGSNEDFSSAMQPFFQHIPEPDKAEALDWSYLDSLRHLDEGNGQTSGLLEIPLPPLPVPGSSRVPLNPYSPHDTFYAKSFVNLQSAALSREAVEESFRKAFSLGQHVYFDWFSSIKLYGGPGSKIAEIPEESSAYGLRKAMFVFENYARTHTGQPPFLNEISDWVENMHRPLEAGCDSSAASPSYADPSLNCSRAHDLYYGPEKTAKLQRIKKAVDPQNLFWNPQGISPDGPNGC
ncbi:hypothetical protein MMC30_008114 [Trapelia coarctata]|nr:hypothetical protein [Trapelia coarctata]